jgi:hypothetical protein
MIVFLLKSLAMYFALKKCAVSESVIPGVRGTR